MTNRLAAFASLIVIAGLVIACGAAQPAPQPQAPAPTAVPTASISPTTPPPTTGSNAEAQQAAGMAAYERSCSRCHGPNLEDGFSPKLSKPVLANYGTASQLYEYLRSAMPKGNAGSLSSQQYYDITGYLLSKQGLIAEGQVVDADSAPSIRLSE